MAACLKHTRKVWADSLAQRRFDTTALQKLVVTKARPGWVRAVLPVGQEHLNNHGTTHGGLLCTLVDTVTWLALQSFGDPTPSGASCNISCEFVKPGGVAGEELVGIGEVKQLGRRLTFMRISFYVNDRLVAYGSHTSMGEHNMTTRFSPDGEVEMDPKEADAAAKKDKAAREALEAKL